MNVKEPPSDTSVNFLTWVVTAKAEVGRFSRVGPLPAAGESDAPARPPDVEPGPPDL
jgi:hypothetical protein